MPNNLRHALEKSMFEYQIPEAGDHSIDLGDKWFSVPPIRTQEGQAVPQRRPATRSEHRAKLELESGRFH